MEQEEAKHSHVWDDDLLHREGEARFLIDFLSRRSNELAESGQTKSFVLNINAQWGQGKTFFLRRFAGQLAEEGYVSAYVNAWTDDHAADPLIPLIATLDHALQPIAKKQEAIKTAWDNAKTSGLGVVSSAPAMALKHLIGHTEAKPLAGENGSALGAVMDAALKNNGAPCGSPEAQQAGDADKLLRDEYAKCLLKHFRTTKASIFAFRYSLWRLASALIDADKKLPIFIIVDELDRCRPAYAIGLLERIKHLFDVTAVVFVVATDTKQLGCSIRAVYGSDFESQRYLMHFFDYIYTFAAPDISRVVEVFFESRNIDLSLLSSPVLDPIPFTIQMFCHAGLDLQRIEQCLEQLHTIVTGWSCKCKIQLLYLLPLIISYETGDKEVFHALAEPDANREIAHGMFVKNDWNVSFTGGLFAKAEQVGVCALIDHVREALKCDLGALTRTCADESLSHRWLRQQFSEELKLLHNGDYHHHSVVEKYHWLVQQAGRLTSN